MMSDRFSQPAENREVILAMVAMLSICFLSYKQFMLPQQESIEVMKTQMAVFEEQKNTLIQLNQSLRARQAELQRESQLTSGTVQEDPRLQLIQRYKEQRFESISELFRLLTSSRFKGGVEITTMQHDLPMARTGFKETQFTLSGVGDFTNVLKFLKNLQDIEALTSIENLEMKQTSSESLIQITITGVFFELDEDHV